MTTSLVAMALWSRDLRTVEAFATSFWVGKKKESPQLVGGHLQNVYPSMHKQQAGSTTMSRRQHQSSSNSNFSISQYAVTSTVTGNLAVTEIMLVVVDSNSGQMTVTAHQNDGHSSSTDENVDSSGSSSKNISRSQERRALVFETQIPEEAFISQFRMDHANDSFIGVVKTEADAQAEFEQAVASGNQTAGLVTVVDESRSMPIRGMRRFAVTVTLPVSTDPKSEYPAYFYLTYEELLTSQRAAGLLTHRLALDTILEDAAVDFVNVSVVLFPDLKPPGESARRQSENEVLSVCDIKATAGTETAAVVGRLPPLSIVQSGTGCRWHYEHRGQKIKEVLDFTLKVPETDKNGLLLIGKRRNSSALHEVNRPVADNTCFMHLWSPVFEEAIPKLVVFVLDISGSMEGTKMEDMKRAFSTIVTQLESRDWFAIITYDDLVTHWPDASKTCQTFDDCAGNGGDGNTPYENAHLLQATSKNVQEAQQWISTLRAVGGTNIFGGTKAGMDLLRRRMALLDNQIKSLADVYGGVKSTKNSKPNPFLLLEIMLSDGAPSAGDFTAPHEIIKRISEINRRMNVGEEALMPVSERVHLFTLAFGASLQLSFMRDLALSNSGYTVQIYEDEVGDSTVQFQDFWSAVKTPMATDIQYAFKQGSGTVVKPLLAERSNIEDGFAIEYGIHLQETENAVTTRDRYPALMQGSQALFIGTFNSSDTMDEQVTCQLWCGTVNTSPPSSSETSAIEQIEQTFIATTTTAPSQLDGFDFFAFCQRAQVNKRVADLLSLLRVQEAFLSSKSWYGSLSETEPTSSAAANRTREVAEKLAIRYGLVVQGLTAMVVVGDEKYMQSGGERESMADQESMLAAGLPLGGTAVAPGGGSTGASASTPKTSVFFAEGDSSSAKKLSSSISFILILWCGAASSK